MLLFKHYVMMAGADGFEPANVGSKNRCLTTWRRPKTLKMLITIINMIIFTQKTQIVNSVLEQKIFYQKIIINLQIDMLIIAYYYEYCYY